MSETAPLSKSALIISLAGHLAQSLGIDLNNEDELNGAREIAEKCLDYFASSVRGAPGNAAQLMTWIIMSAVWEGQRPQEDINRFFSAVNLSPDRLMAAWEALEPEERAGPFTVALIPGNLQDADISDVVRALFASRGTAA